MEATNSGRSRTSSRSWKLCHSTTNDAIKSILDLVIPDSCWLRTFIQLGLTLLPSQCVVTALHLITKTYAVSHVHAKCWTHFTPLIIGMLHDFFMFLSSADFFVYFFFSKSSFVTTIRVLTFWIPNSLESYQARHIVGPHLNPNCLQRLSADDKMTPVFTWTYNSI